VLLLCLLFFVRYEKKRRASAAACLATAIALKIVPLVLLLFLALCREWRILAGSLAAAAALWLSPIVLVGSRTWPLYEGYVREFLLARALPVSGGAGIDFTPSGFIGRFLPAVADSALVRFGSVALILSAEALDPNVRPHATVSLSAALFWGCLWIARLDRSGPYYFVALATLCVGLLWTSPLAIGERDVGPGPPVDLRDVD